MPSCTLIYRGKEVRRSTIIDPDDALELCLDSDSDLDEVLNEALGGNCSSSDSEDSSSPDEPKPRTSARYTGETPRSSHPPRKKRRRTDISEDEELQVQGSPNTASSPASFRMHLSEDETEHDTSDHPDDIQDAPDDAEEQYADAEDGDNSDSDAGQDGIDDPDEDAVDIDEQLNWEKLQGGEAGPTVFEFKGTPGVNPQCGLHADTVTPLDCYKQFISDDIFEDMKTETNRYASQCRGDEASSWETTVGELKVFWALCLLMGILGKPALYLYWSTREILRTPLFAKTITRDRFKDVLRYLHFSNNETRLPRTDVNYDPLFKVRQFYKTVTSSFQHVFTPGEFISVDEGMIRFFGRLSFKTYNPQKPSKYGMKAYKVCDQTGYTYRFQLYTGKTEYIWGAHRGLIALVLNLLTGLLREGRKVFMDNFYTSPTLFLQLFQYKTNACGTVRSNRKNMPKDFNKKTIKLKQGESMFVKARNLVAMLWKDKRDVSMLSTMHDGHFAETGKQNRQTGDNIQKPAMVVDYNKHMGSVDVSDFLTNKYADVRKSLKWYKKLVFHLSDLSATNAYIVYNTLVQKPIKHIDFIITLVEQLLAEGQMEGHDRPRPSMKGRKMSPTSTREKPSRLEYSTSDHWPAQIPPTDKKAKPTRMCEVCKPQRSETRYFCPACDVPLHPLCFRAYHTCLNYKTED